MYPVNAGVIASRSNATVMTLGINALEHGKGIYSASGTKEREN